MKPWLLHFVFAATLCAPRAFAQVSGSYAPAAWKKPVVATGKYVLSFDGVDDRFDATDAGLPSGSSARAISLWIKPTTMATGTHQTLFGYGTYSSTNYIGAYITPTGSLMISPHGAGGTWALPNDGSWIHLVVNVVPPIYSVYVNGAFVSDVSMTTNTVLGGTFYLGYEQPSSSLFYAGRMADLRIYSSALSPGEVTALYNGGSVTCAAVGSSLLRWYQFREASGSSARNSGSGTANGTLSNGVSHVSDAAQCM